MGLILVLWIKKVQSIPDHYLGCLLYHKRSPQNLRLLSQTMRLGSSIRTRGVLECIRVEVLLLDETSSPG